MTKKQTTKKPKQTEVQRLREELKQARTKVGNQASELQLAQSKLQYAEVRRACLPHYAHFAEDSRCGTRAHAAVRRWNSTQLSLRVDAVSADGTVLDGRTYVDVSDLGFTDAQGARDEGRFVAKLVGAVSFAAGLGVMAILIAIFA